MSPWIKRIQKELGVDEKKATKAWGEAITITEDMYGKKQSDFTVKEYEFALKTAKEILFKSESRVSISEFIKSGLTAQAYIEAVVTSTDFSIPTPIQNLKPDDEEEEETLVIDEKEVKESKKNDYTINEEDDEEWNNKVKEQVLSTLSEEDREKFRRKALAAKASIQD